MLQDPKKYNVYNDIFRYQDETFEDTENDETVDGTAGMVKMISLISSVILWRNGLVVVTNTQLHEIQILHVACPKFAMMTSDDPGWKYGSQYCAFVSQPFHNNNSAST